jgi:hypothetical protein
VRWVEPSSLRSSLADGGWQKPPVVFYSGGAPQ